MPTGQTSIEDGFIANSATLFSQNHIQSGTPETPDGKLKAKTLPHGNLEAPRAANCGDFKTERRGHDPVRQAPNPLIKLHKNEIL